MVGSVEGILGLRPDFNGIRISPSIPADWKGFEMKKFFRGKWMNIKVVNENGSQAGDESITLNGEEIAGDYIYAAQLQDINEVIVKLA